MATIRNSPNIPINQIDKDFNSLLNDNIAVLFETNKNIDTHQKFERLYKNSKSLKYLIFITKEENAYGVPYSFNEVLSKYNIDSPLLQNKVYQPTKPKFDATTIAINAPLNESVLKFLIVKNNYSLISFTKLSLTNEISIFIILIFVIAIVLITLFVKLTITKPLIEVAQGLTIIAAGNFSKRIRLRFGGELGDLIRNFNELGRRLQVYEEKNSNQLLSEKIKLESVITTITDGALLLDTNLCIVLVNTTAIKIFGWKTKNRLIGTPIWNHLPIILQKKLFVILQDILLDTQSAIFDCNIENELPNLPNRSIRLFLNIVYDSPDVNKIPIGIGITIQDKTKEFELDQKQNRFISNISHELRTPLFNIKSFIETIQEYDYTLSNWQKRYFLNIVQKETNRLTRLVNDILCISKLDSVKKVPLGIMNINETINQTGANYQILAKDKNLYLHSQLFKSSLLVQGNKDLLLQALMNLVGNALKFTHKKGEIIMRAYPIKNKKIRVEIVDTGIGIIDIQQPYIFQRFYRIENEVHILKGTGLGLAIVETILSEHKAEINVISRYNIGSAFWFDLLEE